MEVIINGEKYIKKSVLKLSLITAELRLKDKLKDPLEGVPRIQIEAMNLNLNKIREAFDTLHSIKEIVEDSLCCPEDYPCKQSLADIRDLGKKWSFPEHTRKAQSSDVVRGNMFWYKGFEINGSGHKTNGGPYCKIVHDVIDPLSDFKAYNDMDGCRYGLEGAYIVV